MIIKSARLLFSIFGVFGSRKLTTFNSSAPQVETGKILVEGGEIAYKKFFTQDTFEKTPLMVLHGGPAVSHDYLLKLKYLATERPIIFYDQLGTGLSDKPTMEDEFWKLPRFVKEFKTVCEGLNISDCHIFGHSWGAAIALEYALSQPTGLQSLVLASPLISVPRWAQDSVRLVEAMPQPFKDIILTHEAEGRFEGEEYRNARNEYMKRYLFRLETWPEDLMHSLRNENPAIRLKLFGSKGPRHPEGLMKSYDLMDSLHKINVPVLITCGRYDSSTPETLTLCQQSMPNAKLEIFEKSSHMPHIEETENYIKAIREFLNNVFKPTPEKRVSPCFSQSD